MFGRKNSWGTFSFGILAGLGLGMLFAPDTGNATRKEAKKKVDALKQEWEKRKPELEAWAKDVQAKIKDKAPEVKEKVQAAAVTIRERAQQEIGRAREAYTDKQEKKVQ
ncbi:MAG TPA: YtxH domain-containing protein [bacterium]|nr:YtxH domain-containing protein [bacterium]